ncbi:MAG: GAF domain-containing protein, partial [Saprospiraceae bacterium]|nr:GAF domain-containing protein [Saprospiraceae bacterium]
EGSADHVFDQKKMLIMSDLERFAHVHNPLLDSMRKQKVRSFIICPLEYEKDIIGFLELTSGKPHVLNSVLANKLEEVTQLFTVAMQRSLEEMETRKEAIVQEKFTSIHPSVSWRFFEVAENVLQARQQGRPDPNEEVIFRDVIPIYGQFDIRGSSTARNLSIQADLVKQLVRAEEVMAAALKRKEWPIYDQLGHRIRAYREHLESSINAGDEVKILDFLKSEIYPVFNHLASMDGALSDTVGAYKMALDPELGVIYEKRKKYEDSVTMINEAIAQLVDEEEARAQAMFPHYFEKYKTDGVEYNLYVGQSLLQNLTFDPVHLKNLRIWQLLMTYRVEQHLREMQSALPMPLEITSLILAHSAPLSIKFRQDEKKFDVDGAYNIRYEIVKKRIDKANIKGTTERLTQPGKLAIVYSHDDEVFEYDQYLQYMKAQGMLTGDIEHVELEDLQGTAGLKALRGTLQYSDTPIDTTDLEKAIQEVKN